MGGVGVEGISSAARTICDHPTSASYTGAQLRAPQLSMTEDSSMGPGSPTSSPRRQRGPRPAPAPP